MLNLDLLPEFVLDDLQERLAKRTDTDAAIRDLSVREAFDEYLGWNGIHGFTDNFIDALDGIRAASNEKPKRISVMMIGNGKPVCAMFEGESAEQEATNAYMTLCCKHFPDFDQRCLEILDSMSETQGDVTICMCPVSQIDTD